MLQEISPHPGMLIIDPLDAHIGQARKPAIPESLLHHTQHLALMAHALNIPILATMNLPADHASHTVHILRHCPAAASVLFATRDPQCPSQRLLLSLRAPSATPPPPAVFTITNAHADFAASVPAPDALDPPLTVSSDAFMPRSALFQSDFAASWLHKQLTAAGGSAPLRDLLARAEEDRVPITTLYNARRRMGLQARRRGFGAAACATWSLPTFSTTTAVPAPQTADA